MNNFELETEVLELIDRNTEGDYWDFKQQWYATNADLLHDIICMANSPANRDCYIIIGIQDGTWDVLGVDSSDEKRKNQQNVIDVIRQKPKWAGGHSPEVYVKTISISDKEIDLIIIKQSDNTPFYLLGDYTGEGNPIFKGSIYTRKGDTNTPRNSTADLYDAELLWKRRFGLLYNPSKRAKNYLMDYNNWERRGGKKIESGINRIFYYEPDPDYTIQFSTNRSLFESMKTWRLKDINIDVDCSHFYLFSFYNVCCYTDFSNSEKIALYYKDIPLFSDVLECFDEGKMNIVPPDLFRLCYIKDSFRYLLFEFVFKHNNRSYFKEIERTLLRVMPLYKTENERHEFMTYIVDKGYNYTNLNLDRTQINGEALARLDSTNIGACEFYGIQAIAKQFAEKIERDKNLVINFAHPNNVEFDKITENLRFGKMLVDWLDDWRNNRGDIL